MSHRAGAAGEMEAMALLCVLRLALGKPVGDLQLDWQRVLELAATERCAPLAWLRSAEEIVHTAPATVSAAWRRHVLCSADAALGQLAELAVIIDRLQSAGVNVAVVKGLPLSMMLYGDLAARPSTDFDLAVPASERACAHDVLTASGWRHSSGQAPAEGLYLSPGAAHCGSLELHSSLTDDNLVSHIQLKVGETRQVHCEGIAIPAACGAILPLFLAVHLAKHATAPLLWWIDFATLWELTPASKRTDIRVLAQQTRLDAYLEWALSGTELLRRAALTGGDSASQALLQLRALHHEHNAVRVARLASGYVASARVILAWAWPRAMRADVGAYLADARRRLRRAPAVVLKRMRSRRMGWEKPA